MAKEQSAPDTKRLTQSVRGAARFISILPSESSSSPARLRPMQEVAHGPVRRTPGFDGSTEVRVRADLRIVDAVRLRTVHGAPANVENLLHRVHVRLASRAVQARDRQRLQKVPAHRPRRSYGPARRSATAVSKPFVCSRSRSARYDSVRITRSNWLR